MNSQDWKCPVCSYYAANGDEQDQHIQATGHLAQSTTGDAGTTFHSKGGSASMDYTNQTGYAPGATNQVDSSKPEDRQSKEYKKGE